MVNLQKSILLINPSYTTIYRATTISEGVPYTPVLSLATIAAPLLNYGYNARIIDLNMTGGSLKEVFLSELKKNSPQYVGITFTTPLYEEVIKICRWVKEYDEKIKIEGVL